MLKTRKIGGANEKNQVKEEDIMGENARREIPEADSGKEKSAGSSIAVQAGILAIATIVVRIIGLLYRAPLTAIIGDEGNGYYGAAYNIYMIILILSSNSLPAAISRQMSTKIAVGEYRNAQRTFHCALIYSLIVGTAGSLLLKARELAEELGRKVTPMELAGEGKLRIQITDPGVFVPFYCLRVMKML